MKIPPYRQAFQPGAEGGTTYAILRQPPTRYGQYSVAISRSLYASVAKKSMLEYVRKTGTNGTGHVEE